MTVHAIYLASGNSRRFGENKLLYPLKGKPMYLHGLETLHKALSDCDHSLTVVSQYDEILQSAEKLGAIAVKCLESVSGKSFSIRAAVGSIADIKDGDYILFMAADQPFLKERTIKRLIASADEKPLAACISYGDTEASPVMFSAVFTQELCELTGDKGGKAVLRKHNVKCLRVSCDEERELFDIDTPEEADEACIK